MKHEYEKLFKYIKESVEEAPKAAAESFPADYAAQIDHMRGWLDQMVDQVRFELEMMD